MIILKSIIKMNDIMKEEIYKTKGEDYIYHEENNNMI